jgi:hypothetical protein
MNKEQLDDLYLRLHRCKKSDELRVFNKWFEKNPIEPVVVGLSDNQFFSLVQDVFGHCYNPRLEELFVDFKSWQKNQTFAQQEVKEIPVGLSDE